MKGSPPPTQNPRSNATNAPEIIDSESLSHTAIKRTSSDAFLVRDKKTATVTPNKMPNK